MSLSIEQMILDAKRLGKSDTHAENSVNPKRIR